MLRAFDVLLHRVAAELVGVLCSLRAAVALDAEVRRSMPGYDAG